MQAVHVIPHTPFVGPEGHNSRHEALRSVVPGLTLAWHPRQLNGRWDLALVEMDAPMPRATRTVRLERVRTHPTTQADCDLSIPIGPYEGQAGSVGPLVRIGPESARDIPLLLVPSRGQNDQWYRDLPGQRGGWELMPRAEVVICGGGGGSLYEALWSGCRVVCLPQCVEQLIRASQAVEAGESVIVLDAREARRLDYAIVAVRSMDSLGRREPGSAAFARMVA